MGTTLGEPKIQTVNQESIPTWNTAGRPQNARKGTIGFNFQTNNLEFWNGTAWLTLRMEKV